MKNEAYRMPWGAGETEYIEKHSRFIGHVWPVKTEEEALSYLSEMREKYWDASHNVYCYRIRETGAMRYSDDGEPGGTAGMPSLQVFLNEKLENFCCVVTRYFGGILLGAGGLVRAYSHTAKLALDAAGRAEVRLWKRLLVSCNYGQFERVRNYLLGESGVMEEQDFAADVLLTVLVPAERTEQVKAGLVELTCGTAQAEDAGEEFRPFRLE